MSYLKFYKLDADPFRNEPESRFYFEGAVQQQARMRLERAIQQRKGLAVLIAGQGCGKTTLAHHILDDLSGAESATRMLIVPHPNCGPGWLLPEINRAFGVGDPAEDFIASLDPKALIDALEIVEIHSDLGPLIVRIQLRLNDGVFYSVGEECAVRQAGQSIVHSVVDE